MLFATDLAVVFDFTHSLAALDATEKLQGETFEMNCGREKPDCPIRDKSSQSNTGCG
jgi:hypothetical protein